MLRILAAAAALWAAFLLPAAAQQVACVSSVAAADEAARNAGEELAWIGKTSDGAIMRFYLGRDTWTVFFENNGSWCTAPTMAGRVAKAGAA
jgi:hypothetical protein